MSEISSFLTRILTDLAAETGRFSVKTTSDGFLNILEFTDGTSINTFASHLGANSDAASAIAIDKVATSSLLETRGVAHIPHYLYYSSKMYSDEKQKLFEAVRAAFKIADLHDGQPAIVIKPNCGTSGRDVRLAHSEQEAAEIAEKVLVSNLSIAISPYYAAEAEYRCTYLNGEVRFLYRKIHTKDWRFNLHAGSASEVLDEKDPKYRAVVELAIKAAKAIDINFAHIDIMEKDGQLAVLEINSAVTYAIFSKQHPECYDKLKSIYKDAIDLIYNRRVSQS